MKSRTTDWKFNRKTTHNTFSAASLLLSRVIRSSHSYTRVDKRGDTVSSISLISDPEVVVCGNRKLCVNYWFILCLKALWFRRLIKTKWIRCQWKLAVNKYISCRPSLQACLWVADTASQYHVSVYRDGQLIHQIEQYHSGCDCVCLFVDMIRDISYILP